MATERAVLTALLLGAALCLSGCGHLAPLRGLAFTKTVTPYTTRFHHTPVGSKSCTIHDYRLQEPVTRYGISAEWDTNVVHQAAEKAGITRIYYADVQTLSFVFGIFRRKTLIIYGD